MRLASCLASRIWHHKLADVRVVPTQNASKHPNKEEKIKSSLLFLKNKAKTLEGIYNNAKYIIFNEVNFNQEDLKLIDDKAKKIITDFNKNINDLKDLNKEILEPIVNNLIKTHETNRNNR